MSTKKEKCCEECECEVFSRAAGLGHKPHCKSPSCTCHQSESIEWEKEVNDFRNGVQDAPDTDEYIRENLPRVLSQAITTAVAKDRELGNPYNSVSTWKEIGKNRGYWGFFKDQVISAREKELVEEVEKKSFRGFAPYEQDYLIKKEDVLSILKH